jgi:hypothetical protein
MDMNTRNSKSVWRRGLGTYKKKGRKKTTEKYIGREYQVEPSHALLSLLLPTLCKCAE